MKLRKRLSNSPRLNRFLARRFAAYIRLAYRTSTYSCEGMEEISAEIRAGRPVIMGLMHQRLMLSPFMFPPRDEGDICSITSAAKAGKLAGLVQEEFGFQTVPLPRKQSHVALSRAIVGKMREGVSVGFAVDGPSGPSGVAKTVPLAWARLTGRPIYLTAFSARRGFRLGTWDRLFVPLPWTSGVILCERFAEDVPKKPTETETEALRLALETQLTALCARADAACGHSTPLL